MNSRFFTALLWCGWGWLNSLSTAFVVTDSHLAHQPTSVLSAPSTFPSNELAALQDLYNSTNGWNWSWKNTTSFGNVWNFTDPDPNPCTQRWQGVSCSTQCLTSPSTASCSILSLVLDGYALNGTLSNTLDALSSLQTLQLSNNPLLTGTIPWSSLVLLTNLIEMKLNQNQLNGSITSSINLLTHLQVLDLSDNHLTSTIPWGITQLIDLTELNVYGNSLTGNLPFSGSNMNVNWNKLLTFNISKNALNGTLSEAFCTTTGPNKIQMNALQIFSIGENIFTGTLPSCLGNTWSSTLEVFSIYDNDFSGRVPVNVTLWNSLQEFDLSKNNFVGTFSSIWKAMSSHWPLLKYFDISENHFNGDFTVPLGEMPHLQVMNLAGNEFAGQLATYLGFSSTTGSSTSPASSSLTALQSFALDNNRIAGTIPNGISTLQRLKVLSLSDNLINGTIPWTLTNLQQLEYVNVSYNLLKGNLIASTTEISMLWSNMTSLKVLDAAANFLDGTIPLTLLSSNMSSLEELYLNNNLFKGHLLSYPTTTTPMLTTPTKLTTLSLTYNVLIGSIPQSFSTLFPQLTYLSFALNRMTGSIPSSFNDLTSLQTLYLYGNFFSGTLPSNFLSECASLQMIDISTNFFNGTIPNVCYGGNMSSSTLLPVTSGLQILHFETNNFTGNLPDNFLRSSKCQLPQIEEVYFGQNKLTGNLTYANDLFLGWNNIHRIDLSNNQLTGTFPANLFALIELTSLKMDNNFFSGVLLNQFQTLNYLRELTLSLNLLEGSLPSTLSSCSHLQTLDLNSNEFEGTVPQSYFTVGATATSSSSSSSSSSGNYTTGFRALETMNLAFNQLMGNFTEEDFAYTRDIYNHNNEIWQSLVQWQINNNYFTGNIPSTLFILEKIKSIYIQSNYFQGEWKLIKPITGLSLLENLNLDSNLLTGTLSSNLTYYERISNFNISVNYFSGTLSSKVFQSLENLELVDLSNNKFTGNLVDIFTNTFRLRLLFAENNYFTGRFQDIFKNMKYNTSDGSKLSSRLRSIDLSNNAISGSLSSDFFIAQNLSSLALVKNCMTGSIPEEICSNRFMQSLALDGLHTAEACQMKIFPWFSSYVLGGSIRGTIPSCLFEMEGLSILHLSGNNIEGNIPDDITIPSALSDLSLSHNQLTGSIPKAIQQHSFVNLDLSFNKLNGKLVSSMSSYDSDDQSLTLDVNRLSGGIPKSLVHALDIDILSGNLFNCGFGDRSQALPHNDQNYESYECGSNMLNIPLIIWSIIAFVLLIIFLLRNKVLQSEQNREEFHAIVTNLQLWWSVFSFKPIKGSSSRALNSFGLDLALLRRLCTSWTVLVVIVLVPLYYCFTLYYRTHEYTYAWVISLAYISGRVPAGITFAVLLVILLWVEYHIQHIYNEFLRGKQTGLSAERDREVKKQQKKASANTLKKDTIGNADEKVMDEEEDDGDDNDGNGLYRSTRRSYFSKRNGYYSDQQAIMPSRRRSHIASRGGLNASVDNDGGIDLDEEDVDEGDQSTNGDNQEDKERKTENHSEGDHDEEGPVSMISKSFAESHPSLFKRNDSMVGESSYGIHADDDPEGGQPEAKDSLFSLARSTFATRPFSVFAQQNNQKKSNTEVNNRTTTTNSTHISTRQRRQQEEAIKNRELKRSKWKWILYSILLIVGNILIVLAINACYVYVITRSLNPFLTGFVTLFVTLFKITWGMVVVAGYFCNVFDHTLDFVLKDLRTKVRHSLANRVSNIFTTGVAGTGTGTGANSRSVGMGVAMATTHQEQQRRDRLKMLENERINYIRWQNRYDKLVSRSLILLSLFNTVVAPLLAVLLISPECFYYVIRPPGSVSVTYKYLNCEYGIVDTSEGNYCLGKSIGSHTVSYNPAFNYSYQCTSSLLANFVDVYLYRYLISGILLPLVLLFCKRRQESLYQQYCFQKELTDRQRSKLKVWIRLYSILLPIPARIVSLHPINIRSSAMNHDSMLSNNDSVIENPLSSSASLSTSPSTVDQSNSSMSSQNQSQGSKSMMNPALSITSIEPIKIPDNEMLHSMAMPVHDINQTFVARKFSTLLVGDLAILLTFGTIFPPLAIVIFISIVVHTAISQVVIGRFICLASLHRIFVPFIAIMKRETATVGSLVALAIAPITVLATVFWSFFLFDIMGDDRGTERSIWILLAMPLLLVLIRTAWFMYSSRSFNRSLRKWLGLTPKQQPENGKNDDGLDESEQDGLEMRPSVRPLSMPKDSSLSRGQGHPTSIDSEFSSRLVYSYDIRESNDEGGEDGPIGRQSDKTHVSI